jgi:hypothetical protein
MNLITVSFELVEKKQTEFIQVVEQLTGLWNNKGFTVTLFRETAQKSRFSLLLLSENNVDELTSLIQSEPDIRELFEKMKDSECRVVVSSMEQIV